jgi:hypothetical protein
MLCQQLFFRSRGGDGSALLAGVCEFRRLFGHAYDADDKYLKVLDNTFLFNVVDDPMERANLKERRKAEASSLS